MTSKILASLIMVIGTVVFALIYVAGDGTDDTLKIGVVLPRTGAFSPIAEEIQRGVEIGVQEAEESGIRVSAVYEDNKSDFGKEAASAATKILSIDKVDIGMMLFVEEAKATAPLFNEREVPLLILWDSTKYIDDAGDYIFSSGFSTEIAGEAMATYAFSNLGLRRVAIFQHTDAWADTIASAFKEKFISLGGAIVYEESLAPSVDDYRTSIAKIKDARPDGVYAPMLLPGLASFILQADQTRLNATLLTGDALLQDTIRQLKSSSEGVYYTNVYTDERDILFSKYKAKYGSDPVDVTLVSMGYDGVIYATRASQKHETNFRDALLAELGGKTLDRIEKVYKVVDGKSVEVK